MKARFIKHNSRQRTIVRASTIDVFAAIKPQIESLGLVECGAVRYVLHILFWWRKPKVKK